MYTENHHSSEDEFFPSFDGEFETDKDGKMIIRFEQEQYEEIVKLAMECNLSVKEFISYRLFGSADM